MPLRTDDRFIPRNGPQAVAWLAQRMGGVQRELGKMQRFGFAAEDPDTGTANIDVFADELFKMERAMYTCMNFMRGDVPAVAPPGLLERLQAAELALRNIHHEMAGCVLPAEDNQVGRKYDVDPETAATVDTITVDYFAWLNEQREPLSEDEQDDR